MAVLVLTEVPPSKARKQTHPQNTWPNREPTKNLQMALNGTSAPLSRALRHNLSHSAPTLPNHGVRLAAGWGDRKAPALPLGKVPKSSLIMAKSAPDIQLKHLFHLTWCCWVSSPKSLLQRSTLKRVPRWWGENRWSHSSVSCQPEAAAVPRGGWASHVLRYQLKTFY